MPYVVSAPSMLLIFSGWFFSVPVMVSFHFGNFAGTIISDFLLQCRTKKFTDFPLWIQPEEIIIIFRNADRELLH